ncbi:MAG TPA: flagellar hook capping FlgD N-terminal domain-containing protein [Solirubrobacteraceae bacterium]|nr:flagellar hook capping FlgD N-terminal domain-containing protein [Solirubrobacteraceae bacterium]
MSVSAPNTASSTIGPTTTSGSASSVAGSLNEGDFLNLMMDQMKNQDPLNPSDPTQYMSELASFSSLDEQIQIQESSSQSASNQAASSALQMLGQNVSYTDSNGNSASGTVTAVDFTSSGPTLTIGGTTGITLSEITGANSSSTDSSSQSS